MSVLKSSLTDPTPAPPAYSNLFETDETLRSLTIHLGKRQEIDDSFLIRFREELARRTGGAEFEEIVFDLAEILILPSSALGLIAAVGQQGIKVRITNASNPVREDFQLTGLYRIVELEPGPEPPNK